MVVADGVLGQPDSEAYIPGTMVAFPVSEFGSKLLPIVSGNFGDVDELDSTPF